MGELNEVHNYIFEWGLSDTSHLRGSPRPLAWVISGTYFTLFTFYLGYAGKPSDVSVDPM